MQVRIEDVSPIEKKLVVEVPWDTVSARLADAYRELAKDVHLKGFRKGKVPRTVLQRMFGKRVSAEVATQLVRESFVNAATEHNLQVVSEPRVEQELELKSGQPFSFEAFVEVRGEVVAKDYDGMPLKRRPLSVPEAAVDEALEAVHGPKARQGKALGQINHRRHTPDGQGEEKGWNNRRALGAARASPNHSSTKKKQSLPPKAT